MLQQATVRSRKSGNLLDHPFSRPSKKAARTGPQGRAEGTRKQTQTDTTYTERHS